MNIEKRNVPSKKGMEKTEGLISEKQETTSSRRGDESY